MNFKNMFGNVCGIKIYYCVWKNVCFCREKVVLIIVWYLFVIVN